MKASPTLIAAICTGAVTTLSLAGPSDRLALAESNGGAIYQNRCAICHERSGEGVPGAFPPLAQNPHVTTSDPSAAIVAVLNGMLVAITVHGHRYTGGMPGWRDFLSDADVAAVVTYIRTSWGNRASTVTASQVARIRGNASTLKP